MPEENNQKRSPLEALQEKLYQSGAQIENRPSAPEIFQPKEVEPERPITNWEAGDNQEFMTVKQFKKRKLFVRLMSFLAFVVIAMISYWSYVYLFRTFRPTDVSVTVKGPETVESGENIKFYVSYQNRSDFEIEDAVLTFSWPKGAVPNNSSKLITEKRIGVIGAGREETMSFDGKFFGAKNDKLTANAVLKYSVRGQGSHEEKGFFDSVVSKTPFSIVVSMPPRAVSGNEVDIVLEYQNLSETAFDDMRLEVEYPEGFVFSSSEPSPSSSGNVWNFDKIMGKEIGKIRIKGVLNGQDGEAKLFQTRIGKVERDQLISYDEEQTSVVLSSTILFVYQTVNDSRELNVSPDEGVNYKIAYRNTSDIAIPNVVISASLDSRVVDFKTLNIRWGSFSGATNSIIWNASGKPELALLGPGETGEVTFYVRTKKTISITSPSDKNLVVSSMAKITSDQIPEALKGIPIGNEDKIDVRLNTTANVSASGYYKSAPIENSGPIPPRVGQKTTYNIIWQLTNTSNDIDNARIESALPPNVMWEGKVSPSDLNISYEKSTGRIVWDIGKISAGTGFIKPALQVAFQVSVTPGIADVGRPLDLIKEAVFSGIDAFTGVEISKKAESKTTYLLEDSYIIEKRGWDVTQ